MIRSVRDEAEEGSDPPGPPWSERKRIHPKRTWSGRVIYDRKPRYFTMKDVQRIINTISPESVPKKESHWIFQTLRKIIEILNKIFPSLELPLRLASRIVDWIEAVTTEGVGGAREEADEVMEEAVVGLLTGMIGELPAESIRRLNEWWKKTYGQEEAPSGINQ